MSLLAELVYSHRSLSNRRHKQRDSAKHPLFSTSTADLPFNLQTPPSISLSYRSSIAKSFNHCYLLSPTTTMASSAQPFGSRSYKLPDRSVNANAMPFSASSFTRRGLGTTTTGDFHGEAGPKGAQHSAPPAPQGPSQDTNPLSRLTEDQREEINEAVFPLPFFPFSPSLYSVLHVIEDKTRMLIWLHGGNSSPSSTSTATDT